MLSCCYSSYLLICCFCGSENTTSFGTPISLTTGAEVEELTAGDCIAIPVDVTTSTGKLTSWTPRLVLSDALEAGIKIEDDSIQAENLVALGGDVITGYNDETTYYGMANIYTKKLGKKTQQGNWNAQPAQMINGVPHSLQVGMIVQQELILMSLKLGSFVQ